MWNTKRYSSTHLRLPRKHQYLTAPVLAAGLLLVPACSRETTDDRYVARVGQSVLTEGDLQEMGDSLSGIGQHATQYITSWVTTELLYQEAMRRGLLETEEVKQQIGALQRRLAINALLEREVYNPDTSLVTEADITALFRKQQETFRLREDVVNLSYVLFDDRDAANSFRTTVLRGTPWNAALAAVQADTTHRPHVLQTALRYYFTRGTLFPEELWKLARTLGKEEVSFVVRTDAGYYVLVVHSVKHQRDVPDYEYVRDEIRNRLLIEQSRKRYDLLLASLRSRFPVDIRLPQEDTTGIQQEQP